MVFIIDKYHYNGHYFCIFNHILYSSYRAQKKVVLFWFSEKLVNSSTSSNVNLREEEGSLFCSTVNFMTYRASVFLSKVVCCLTGEKKCFKWCCYRYSSALWLTTWEKMYRLIYQLANVTHAIFRWLNLIWLQTEGKQ